ncbi:hypothetical protein GM418_02195 [Maribellus comscasis]|uniref:Outer membrane protein beta-barrel domain-containing protein n=1 Tax=Maribellus comscasis TaxID=2681766 RepID=A0A6I6JXS4_9BACT|nr:hypothetical protein [Maribellus comscasis]QGY42504.1 hypothetical protein GM418_02195 [Maribellus comscasis]
MKKIIFYAALLSLWTFGIKAQNNNQVSLQFSFNQFEVGYQHKIFSPNLWGEIFVGAGNQDVNTRFDDFLTGLKVGYNVFSHKRDKLDVHSIWGIYIPKNKLYTAITPMVGTGTQYARSIGKTGKHNLFISANFRYGKRDYKQKYSSETITVSKTGSFEVSRLVFSLGYSFKF